MNIRTIPPIVPLRVGLGVMYLYSGYHLITDPTAWYWALPLWLQAVIRSIMPLNTYLALQGGVEILLALIFLTWFVRGKMLTGAALISTLEMGGILVLAFVPWSAGNFLITFRDIGLLGASAALFLASRGSAADNGS